MLVSIACVLFLHSYCFRLWELVYLCWFRVLVEIRVIHRYLMD